MVGGGLCGFGAVASLIGTCLRLWGLKNVKRTFCPDFLCNFIRIILTKQNRTHDFPFEIEVLSGEKEGSLWGNILRMRYEEKQ